MQSGREMLPFYLAGEVWSIPRLKPRSTLLPHTTALKQTRKRALSRWLPRTAFHSLFYTLGPQNRVKPRPGMFCFSDSDHVGVSFSFSLCINTRFVLIKDFSSTAMEDLLSQTKCTKWRLLPQEPNPEYKNIHPVENQRFSCLKRRHCWDVPVINYHLPLGIVNLGQVAQGKRELHIVPWLQVKLVIKL